MSGIIGRWFLIGLVLISSVYMGWTLLFSDHGYLVYREEVQQMQQLREQIIQLKHQREQLSEEILRLRNNPDALEELVHRELGYVYPDEYMLIMPEKAVGSAQPLGGSTVAPVGGSKD